MDKISIELFILELYNGNIAIINWVKELAVNVAINSWLIKKINMEDIIEVIIKVEIILKSKEINSCKTKKDKKYPNLVIVKCIKETLKGNPE